MELLLGLGLLSFFCLLYRLYIIKKWKAWPTVDEYIRDYNPTRGRGISCIKCGSKNIWERGFEQPNSPRRIHYCKQCKEGLYRTFSR